MNLNDNHNFSILPEEAGERLDKILIHRFPDGYSRTYFQNLIEEGLVLLDGKALKKRYKPAAGDEIEIYFSVTQEIDVTPENICLDIIYEDQDILIVNKPPGMVVHPAPGNWTGTFVNALLYHCKNLQPLWGFEDLRPGIVHRLDKETSGLLLAAKTKCAHRHLVEQFASRRVKKEYLAICLGNPGNCVINEPIGRHPVQRKMMAVVPDGKPAKTTFQTLQTYGPLSLVRALPETGRTHQIRVHLKHRGTPIVGDAVYGSAQVNEKFHADRQWLHAEKLRFMHPSSNEEMEFTAPLPLDMQRVTQR